MLRPLVQVELACLNKMVKSQQQKKTQALTEKTKSKYY